MSHLWVTGLLWPQDLLSRLMEQHACARRETSLILPTLFPVVL